MMLSLLSNNALMKRFLVYAALEPLVLRLVERAEETGDDGPEKRKAVIGQCRRMFENLVGRGFLPIEATTDLDKTAGELVDLTVSTYNDVGFFPHGDKSEQPERKAARKAANK